MRGGSASFVVRAACVGSLLCALADPSPGLPQEPPRFPADVELVRIDVVVLDREGNPVAGLAAADFEVTEDGRPRALASFEPIVVRPPARPPEHAAGTGSSTAVPAPVEGTRYFLVYFDDVHVRAENTEPVRAHLVRFVEREARDGDWVTILAPLSGLRFTARTAYEREQVPAVARALKGQLIGPRGSDYAAMRSVEYDAASAPAVPDRFASARIGPTPAETYAVAQRRIRQSLAGLAEAIESLAGFRGRKSLILYSEGFIRSPSLPDYDRVVDLARRAHVAIYYVDPRGVSWRLPPDEIDTQSGGTAYLAIATGGRVSATNDLAEPMRQVAVESSAYYLLGFEPAAGEPGERKLKVTVRREGLEVRAPERYFVGATKPVAKPSPPALRAVGRIADSADVPLRVGTFYGGPSKTGEVATTVAVELPRPAGGKDRRLDLLIEARRVGSSVAVRDSAGLAVPAGGGATVVTRELRLVPGLWQARVVVRDTRTEEIGSVLHTYEVPPATGLRISSPVLSDEVESSGAPWPRLRLDRDYRSGTDLYCLYRVFGATPDPATGRPRVAGAYAISARGRVLLEAGLTTIEPARDGQVLRLLGFGLNRFEAGDYTLRLRVVDEVSGETRETAAAFTVVTGSDSPGRP
jgi:VWFA-related protein